MLCQVVDPVTREEGPLWDGDGGVDRGWTFTVDDQTSDRSCRLTLVTVVYVCLEPWVFT